MPRLTMNDAFFVEMRRASVDEVIERLMSIQWGEKPSQKKRENKNKQKNNRT